MHNREVLRTFLAVQGPLGRMEHMEVDPSGVPRPFVFVTYAFRAGCHKDRFDFLFEVAPPKDLRQQKTDEQTLQTTTRSIYTRHVTYTLYRRSAVAKIHFDEVFQNTYWGYYTLTIAANN